MVRESTGFAMLDGKKHGPMWRIDRNYENNDVHFFIFLFLIFREKRERKKHVHSFGHAKQRDIFVSVFGKSKIHDHDGLLSALFQRERKGFERGGLNYIESRIR